MGNERGPWRPSDQPPDDSPADPGSSGSPPANDRAGPGAPPDPPGWVNSGIDLDELDPSGRARRRAARRSSGRGLTRRSKVLKYTALSLAGLLVAVAVAGFYLVRHLLGDVDTVSLDDLKNRPAASRPNADGQTPLNILVLGSQTRDGQTLATHVGNSSKDGTDLSDTAMLVHVNADRTWAEVVSIPRDLFVPIPACTDRLDPSITHPAQSEAQFYDAMGEGGPACAVATVEQMTNVRVDHFVELTFDAFIQLTDAVGGVEVCIPPPGINDADYSGLVLSAGLHTISGNQALAFVRDRHGLVTGEDTQRIRMQQMFMTSLFDKLTSNGTIEDPITLYKIASAVSSNVTVDTDLDSLSTMVSLAESVGTIDKKYMQYVTAPYTLDAPGEYSYDPDGEHSSPGQGFDQLWTYLRDDQPIPGSPAAAAFPATASPTSATSASGRAGDPTPTVPVKDVTVVVYNGTDNPGEADNAAANLTALGMTATAGDAGYQYQGYDTTTIYYAAGEQAQADTLANQIAGSVTALTSNVTGLTLVIGTNAPNEIVATPSATSAMSAAPTTPATDGTDASGTSGSASPSPSSSATIDTESRNGNENLCSDLPGVVTYGGAPGD